MTITASGPVAHIFRTLEGRAIPVGQIRTQLANAILILSGYRPESADAGAARIALVGQEQLLESTVARKQITMTLLEFSNISGVYRVIASLPLELTGFGGRFVA